MTLREALIDTCDVLRPMRREASPVSTICWTPSTFSSFATPPFSAAWLLNSDDFAHPETARPERSATAISRLLVCCISSSLLRVDFDLGDGCRRWRTGCSMGGGLARGVPEVQVQGRDQEEVQQRRGDQPPEDDRGGRVRDLVAGDAAGDRERRQ